MQKFKSHKLMIAASVTKNFYVLLLPAVRAVIFRGMRIDTAVYIYALDLIPAFLLLSYFVIRWAVCKITLDGHTLTVESGIIIKREATVDLSSAIFIRTEGGIILRLLKCRRLTVGNAEKPVIKELYITKSLARCLTECLPQNADIAYDISPPANSALSYAAYNFSWLIAACFAAGFYYGADIAGISALILPLIFLRRIFYDMSEYSFATAVAYGDKIRVGYKSGYTLVTAELARDICGVAEIKSNPFQRKKGRADLRLYVSGTEKKEKIRLRHCNSDNCKVFCENIL